MDEAAQFDEVLKLCDRLSIDVRREHLGGEGGGLCTVRGQRLLFVDLDADIGTQLAASIRAVSAIPEIQSVYLPQVLRELLDQAETRDRSESRGCDRAGS